MANIEQGTAAEAATPRASANPLRNILQFIGPENFSLIVALVVLVLIIMTQTPYFFVPRNLLNVGMNISVVGLLAVGMTFVIVSNGLDISVGSIAGVASISSAIMVTYLHSVPGGIFVGIALGAVLGAVNATIITYLRVNPVVATLATLSAYQGLAFLIAPGGRPVGVLDQNFAQLGSGRLFDVGGFPGIPISFLLLVIVAIAGHFVLRSTVFGRSVYAMGGNPAAARLAGINLTRMKYYIYILSGALAGLAGVIVTARTSSGQPMSGTAGLELETITSVFLGGAILAGGKGTVVGSMLAVLLLGVLSNGMNLLGIPTFYQLVAKGFLLVVAVAIGQFRMARAEKAQARAAAQAKA
jgi:ribose transport system permease protein/L-arabinose transport system permease protein